MPGHEAHCRHSFQLYGVRAEEIHSWMDEPSQIYGSSHRWTRHDLALIPQKFIKEYGLELARQIMLDHILLDREGEPQITLTASNMRILPTVNLKPRDTKEAVRVALGSFFIWAVSFILIIRAGLRFWLPGWIMASLIWFPVGLPLYCKISAHQERLKEARKVLEEHR